MPTTKPVNKRPYPRVSLSLNTDNGANQDDRKGCDINVIVGQYKRHGTLPAVQLKNPLYGDFTASTDLMDQREQMHLAEDRFAELPAQVRTAAENDWVKFLQMFDDPSQRGLLENAGLVIASDDQAGPTPPGVPSPDPAPEPDSESTPTE